MRYNDNSKKEKFFSLYYGFTSTGVDNTAHVAGLVCGMMISILLYHPRGRRI